MMNMFSVVAKKREEAKIDKRRLQIALIGRLECGPFPKKRKFHLINFYPKTIRNNKSYIKQILQALYIHPCYFIQLRNLGLEPAVASDLVKSVYRTSITTKYTASLLTNLAIKIFLDEYKAPVYAQKSIAFVDRETFEVNKNSLFAQLFDMLFQGYTQNLIYSANCAGICFNALYRIIQQKEATEKN